MPLGLGISLACCRWFANFSSARCRKVGRRQLWTRLRRVGQDRPGWEEAYRREAAIRELLNRLKAVTVEADARELGASRATLYRLIERCRTTQTVEGLSGQAGESSHLLAHN